MPNLAVVRIDRADLWAVLTQGARLTIWLDSYSPSTYGYDGTYAALPLREAQLVRLDYEVTSDALVLVVEHVSLPPCDRGYEPVRLNYSIDKPATIGEAVGTISEKRRQRQVDLEP